MYYDEEKKSLMLLDQRLLPFEVRYVECKSALDVASAIKNMTVRGAPAIGVAAAYGMALGDEPATDAKILLASRPTAVNLAWGVNRQLKYENLPLNERKKIMLIEAHKILSEDIDINMRIGALGASLLPDTCTVITHCNAGALATAGYGTALGVIRAAHEAGKKIKVYADETRPRLQGARLTAFELSSLGIDFHLICDNMAAYIMKNEVIDAVITGADRIAANGDAANKIGTYGLSVNARYHGVPFYVAAPLSTFDTSIKDGSQIPIEHRDACEVCQIDAVRLVPENYPVKNPSFDVTDAKLISAIITEKGILRYPYIENIKNLAKIEKF